MRLARQARALLRTKTDSIIPVEGKLDDLFVFDDF